MEDALCAVQAFVGRYTGYLTDVTPPFSKLVDTTRADGNAWRMLLGAISDMFEDKSKESELDWVV